MSEKQRDGLLGICERCKRTTFAPICNTCGPGPEVQLPPLVTPAAFGPQKGDRANTGKLPLDYMSPWAKEGLARVLYQGGIDYAPFNWAKGLSWRETSGSLERHLLLFMKGEDFDSKSNLAHVDHIQANAMFLSHFFHTKTGTDDRLTVWPHLVKP